MTLLERLLDREGVRYRCQIKIKQILISSNIKACDKKQSHTKLPRPLMILPLRDVGTLLLRHPNLIKMENR